MLSALFGSDNSAPSTTATQFNYITANLQSSYNATQTNRDLTLTVATTLSTLYVEVGTAPGSGTSYTFTVYKNGTATALSATISDTNTSATNTVDSVSFAAGDTVSMAVTPANSPASTANTSWNMRASGTGQPIFTGHASTMATSGTFYVTPQSTNSSAATYWANEGDATIIMPTAGTLSLLGLTLNTTPGVGHGYAMTLIVNGVASALSVSVTDTATTATNSVDSIAVAAGDTISLRITASGTPAAGNVDSCMLFTPTVEGEFFFGYGTSATSSTNVVNYEHVFGVGANSWSTTESSRNQQSIGQCTLKKIYVKTGAAPGGAASYTYTVRSNTGNTSLSAVISGASQTGSVTADVAIATADKLALAATPSGTPVAHAGVHIGILATVGTSSSNATTTGNFFIFG